MTRSSTQARQTRRTPATALRPLAHPFVCLTAGVIGVAAVLAFGLAAAGSPALSDAETPVVQWFADISEPFADTVASIVAVAFGSPWAVGPLLILLLLVWALTRDLLRALTSAGIAASAWLASAVVKELVERPRPAVEVASGIHISAEHYSYPSGHTSLAIGLVVAVLFTVGTARKRTRAITLTVIVGVLVVVITMITRLHLGMHYPTDLLAAVVNALAVILIVLPLWLNVLVPWARGGLGEKAWWQAIDAGARP